MCSNNLINYALDVLARGTFGIVIGVLSFIPYSTAQVAVNSNSAAAHSSAILDVSSTNKGMLIPRMTTNQRTNINAPADGLLVYDTDSGSFWYFHSGDWTDLSGQDNMGDHSATQNVELNDNWLSSDGTNNGLFVNSSGKIGVNTNAISADLEIESSVPELRLTDEETQASTIGKSFGKVSWFSRDGSFGNDYGAIGSIELINTSSSAVPDAKMAFSVWLNDGNGNNQITPLTLYPNGNLGISNNWLSADGDDEGIRISNSGRIGIGAPAPGNTRFNVQETDGFGKLAQFEHTGDMVGPTGFTISGGSGDDANVVLFDISTYEEFGSGDDLLTVSGTGNLYVAGVATKPSGPLWGSPSDRRLKKDIKPFTLGLETVEQIEPKYFYYNEKSGYDTSKQQVGVIAQEVLEYAPYMVEEFDKDGESYYKVDPSALTYIFVNAIQELAEENKELKKVLKGFEKRLEELENGSD